MKVLIAVHDEKVQDQLKVGLETFDDISVDCATGAAVYDLVRRVEYSFMILGIQKGTREAFEPLELLKEASPELSILVIGPEQVVSHLREDRLRSRLFGFLRTPINAVEFFRAISRIRKNLESVPAR
jgi:DNA-binding NarL/FixJ family response regulator